jgi:hypothetical protein
MWAGDIKPDGAINISDIMELAKIFNTTSASINFNTTCDFNKDNAINISDIMVIAKHFNTSISSYTAIDYNDPRNLDRQTS